MATGLFIPCFIDQLYPGTGFSMLSVLEKAAELSRSTMKFAYNPEQTCCGQVAFNAGFADEAKHLGEKFIRDFGSYELVVGPSASCIGMVKNYYTEMFYNSALHNENKNLGNKIFEFTDFVISVLGIEDIGGSFTAKITIHDACSALREYGLEDQPRRLLRRIKGLEIAEMSGNEECCGFGGTFSVKHEAISIAMAQQKVQHAMDTGAQFIVSTEASCLMHLESYIKKNKIEIQTMHIADLLAKSLI